MAKRKRQLKPVASERDKLKAKTLDLKHIAKHLLGTSQSHRLVAKEGSAHVFLSEEVMHRVIIAIMEQGQQTGVVRGHERWGLPFEEPIGYRIDAEGNRIPLHYAELKASGERYHVI